MRLPDLSIRQPVFISVIAAATLFGGIYFFSMDADVKTAADDVRNKIGAILAAEEPC